MQLSTIDVPVLIHYNALQCCSSTIKTISCLNYVYKLPYYSHPNSGVINMTENKHSKNVKKTNQDIIDSFDYLGNAASSMDCTGLIPSAPVSEAEIESYEAVYNFRPPVVNIEDPEAEKPPK